METIRTKFQEPFLAATPQRLPTSMCRCMTSMVMPYTSTLNCKTRDRHLQAHPECLQLHLLHQVHPQLAARSRVVAEAAVLLTQQVAVSVLRKQAEAAAVAAHPTQARKTPPLWLTLFLQRH